MIELYNEDNIKVYVDDDERYIGDVSNPRYLKITTHQNDSNYLAIFLEKPYIAGCTITIKGNTVTIDGTSNRQEVALRLYLGKYNATLKGNLIIKMYNGEDVGYFIHTLYDETYVYQVTAKPMINAKVDFILKDKSTIQTDGFAQSVTAYLYDSSVFRLYNREAKIYAYDNSKVATGRFATKLEVDAYDNAEVEAGEDVEVVINDESKLVRF